MNNNSDNKELEILKKKIDKTNENSEFKFNLECNECLINMRKINMELSELKKEYDNKIVLYQERKNKNNKLTEEVQNIDKKLDELKGEIDRRINREKDIRIRYDTLCEGINIIKKYDDIIREINLYDDIRINNEKINKIAEMKNKMDEMMKEIDSMNK